MMMHIDKDGDGVITPAEAYGRQVSPNPNPRLHPRHPLTLAPTLALTLTLPNPHPSQPSSSPPTLTLTRRERRGCRRARSSSLATRGSS